MRILLRRAIGQGGGYPDLDAQLFAPKNIFTGVMVPERFQRVIGFWIFLTEPHRQGATPVVLVHGHSTGPRPFRQLAASLDRDRFEPWFCYYSTGTSLESSAAMLRQSLHRMAERYDVDEVAMVAYSMGGLVSRQALRPYDDGITLPRVPLYIGVANPWGGSEEGRFESERSFSPPSWDDVADGSEFLSHLFDDPLPEHTEFHAIYGLGGEASETLGEENDGIVSRQSLSRPEMVEETTSVTVVAGATHQGVIAHDGALTKIGALLEGRFPPAARPR